MGYIVAYEKNGVKKTETKSSCYDSIVRANELRKKGYKVSCSVKQKSLVDGLTEKTPTNKDLIQNFIRRAEKAINTQRKHKGEK